jgi:hypothetical protein
MAAIGRNEPCPCGSGKKYKQCCLLKSHRMSWTSRVVISVIALMLIIGVFVFVTSLDEIGGGCPAGQVWSSDHGHCH